MLTSVNQWHWPCCSASRWWGDWSCTSVWWRRPWSGGGRSRTWAPAPRWKYRRIPPGSSEASDSHLWPGKNAGWALSETETESYLLLVDEPGQVGRRMRLPGGTERLQGLADLIFLLDPGDTWLLIREVNYLHVSWLDQCQEGGISHHLAAVTTRVVEVHVPEEQSATIRQEALAIFYFLL